MFLLQLQNNINFKVSRPDIHENVWPHQLKYLGDDDIISVPPYKDQDGRRMIIYKVGKYCYVWPPQTTLFIKFVYLLCNR